jgi:hypothetical protein
MGNRVYDTDELARLMKGVVDGFCGDKDPADGWFAFCELSEFVGYNMDTERFE